jgi:DNA-binding transcriptional LysR family regulator
MVSSLETVELQELRTFVAVGRRLGITAAAELLGVAKSAVSKSLGTLERRLGVRLFERSSRRVALTREGETLLPRAESILAELERLVADARSEFIEPAGAVRIAATPEFGGLLVGRFVPPLLERHPKLQVAMQLEYAHTDLLDPSVDIAFRVGSVHDDRLVAKPLGRFHRILVASPAWVAQHPVRQPADLARCEALLFSEQQLRTEWTLLPVRGDGDAVDVSVQGRLAVRGFNALLAAAEAGLGVARLPAFVAHAALERKSVVRVLPAWTSPPANVHLVHRFGVDRIGRVKAVIAAAQDMVVPLLHELGA